ncbi:unnamed protein product [Oikopleura dioica]|uniref:Sperm microtubule inner protein 1 C-terminal domain-containing protein n=1 Tax=Oikopleura dioica TaxID=34765 RepID=E4WTZ8_OIKDI|nr:unnamed protein product [Oikopleura dioica]
MFFGAVERFSRKKLEQSWSGPLRSTQNPLHRSTDYEPRCQLRARYTEISLSCIKGDTTRERRPQRTKSFVNNEGHKSVFQEILCEKREVISKERLSASAGNERSEKFKNWKMSRELGMTTAVMNFHKENIAKEAHYRLLARQREIEEGFTEEERLAKFAEAQKKRMARQREMIPKVNNMIPEKLEKQEDGVKLPALSRNDDGRSKENVPVDVMKPVEAQIKNQIFNGISKEGLGKQKYLSTRKTLAPQDKYNYQALSSWDYGWDISEALKDYKPSAHARKMIVNQTFYRRNGVRNAPVEI